MPDPAALERDATELLQRLIRFDTVNPPGNEQAAQEFLRELLEGAGFTVELLAAVQGRPNLVARLPGASDGPTLCLLGHVDTVLADPADWQVDPWSGEIRDGCVWGRGAVDMKSQVAAEIAAAVALAREGWRPGSGELLIVVTADEETGAEHGAQWLCAEHPGKVRADLVVNEGAGQRFEYGGDAFYGVCTGEKGVFRFTVSATGRAGHASLPRIGDNALAKLAPVLADLAAARVVPEPAPEAVAILDALGLDRSDMAGSLERMEATDPRLVTFLEPMMGVTMAPTMAAASQKINVLPAHAEIKVDCRALPESDRDHALMRITEAIGAGHRGLLRRDRGGQPVAGGHAADAGDRGLRGARGPGCPGGAGAAAGVQRLALVAGRVPRLRGVRLLPPAGDGAVRRDPADARRRRADPDRGPGHGRALLL